MINHKIIKVCGMRHADNIRQVEALGVDMIGFIFYPPSPRSIHEPPSYLPIHSRRVGVFVDEDRHTVEIMAKRFGLDYIQLHGNESPLYCHSLQTAGLSVIKAFSVAQPSDLPHTGEYEKYCNYFLFDTKCNQHGGSGCPFDWNILHTYRGSTPFLLSGGIGLNNVETLQTFDHPQLAGFDLNSRFESQPGTKEVESIRQFMLKLI